MIARMEKLAVYGLSGDRERMLRGLMGKGCVQLVTPEALDEYGEIAGLVQRCDLDIYELEGRLSRLGAAIAALSKYEKKPGLFAKKPRVPFEKYACGDAMVKAAGLCVRVEAGLRELSEMRSAVSVAKSGIEALEPWRELDAPLSATSTARTDVRYLVLSAREAPEEFEKAIEDAGGAAIKLSEDKAGYYYAVLNFKPEAEAMLAALGGFAYSRAPFTGLRGTAGENIANLERDIRDYEEAIEWVEKSIEGHAQDIGALRLAYDATLLDIDCAKAEGGLMGTQQSFILTGWLPEKKAAAVGKFLSDFPCYYVLTEADQADPEMPVLLENPKWAKPFESIIEMYSMPVPGSIDPAPYMAPFYFLFFGMMFSDAGYGLILTAGCLAMLKFMDTGEGLQKMLKMLAACGASTMIWGFAYGSFFGDAPTVLAKTFFNVDFVLPKLIDPMSEPMTVLIMSMALGLVHIMVGMGLSAYLMIKRGHPWAALFDVGFWYMVFIGLILLVLGGTAGEAGKWIAIAGAAGLVLTQGRDKKNIFGKVTGGVLSLYDITGYFSDVLSYSRILALGLATGVIGSVVNIIGVLLGPGLLGAIVCTVVFIGGHLLNFGINALGSYVHTARLQYVEFFGKFFESGGSPFRPLAANTKYTHAAASAGEEKE